MRFRPPIALALLFAATSGAAAASPWDEAAAVLRENCTKCHGGAKQKAGLDLRSEASAAQGGKFGPGVEPGNPEQSAILNAVLPGADPMMPPDGEGGPLTESEIAALREWVAHFDPAAVEAGSATASLPLPEASPALPAGVRPELAIDFFVERRWAAEGVAASPRCDDATFARRAFLDLAGRIPAADELAAFLADPDSAKRERLAERLIAGPEFAARMAEVFNVVLLGREGDKGNDRGKREGDGWLPYLRWAFAQNRPWDQIARDLIVADPAADGELAGASWFLFEQNNDHQKAAEAAAPALFGKQIQCAQCHDHPVSPEIEQRHYWGLVSFFSRSVNVRTPQGPRVAERAAGGYGKFANLKGESSDAQLVFLLGGEASEPARHEAEDAALYIEPPPEDFLNPPKDDGDKKRRRELKVERAPEPKFSRREALADLALADRPAFAEAFVNRLWAMFLGRGIVHPVDQMDSAHPASHPELLRWLGDDFARSGYDVRRLALALMKSRAYQLAAPVGEVRPLPEFFACAQERPLDADQLYRSMLVAAGHSPDKAGNFPGIAEAALRGAFVERFPDLFAAEFSPDVFQAMFLTNGPTVLDTVIAADAPLVRALQEQSDPGAAAALAFQRILLRAPADDERAAAAQFLARPDSDRESAIRDLCWALLSGAEFRFY